MGEKNVVKMEPKKSENKEQLSYEDLQNVATQLSNQNQQLKAEYKKLAEAYTNREQSNFFARLEWLWRVLESNNKHLTLDFVRSCADEFMNLMTPQEENVESNTKE